MRHLENALFHDASKIQYREPLGALAAGSRVTLRLFGQYIYLQGVTLILIGESLKQEYPMHSHDGWWEVDIDLPAVPGAYWYHFALGTSEGACYYGAASGRSAGRGEVYSQKPLSFQLTVYDASFTTPRSLQQGVIYQIFPDRFCKSSVAPRQEGIIYHRNMGRTVVLHDTFEEVPLYQPLEGQEHYYPCDYYGGDLKGIEEKLPYLAGLGVTILYLNPIFEADSNHRYNISDYRTIDPLLGTNDDFEGLCAKAEGLGIRIILDGVFSHTGSDSVYFNKKGNYPGIGAFQSRKSEYFPWYRFQQFPNQYSCWWGFDTLPEVDEQNPDWQDFIIEGGDSVMSYWMDKGASGYRLDVADELPDNVIEKMRAAIKAQNPEGILLGEVWEDATNKESYGYHRRYALGRGLDSVMNYPLRNHIVSYLLGRESAQAFSAFLADQASNYPPPMYYALMNLLSSHDIARIHTELGAQAPIDEMDREQQAGFRLTIGQSREAAQLQRLAAVIQFMLPGVPSIYYGDEVGMDGARDPFNRMPYRVCDKSLRGFYEKIISLRRSRDALMTGEMCAMAVGDTLVILRVIYGGKDALGMPAKDGLYLLCVNATIEERNFAADLRAVETGLSRDALSYLRNHTFHRAINLWDEETAAVMDGLIEITLPPRGFQLFQIL